MKLLAIFAVIVVVAFQSGYSIGRRHGKQELKHLLVTTKPTGKLSFFGASGPHADIVAHVSLTVADGTKYGDCLVDWMLCSDQLQTNRDQMASGKIWEITAPFHLNWPPLP